LKSLKQNFIQENPEENGNALNLLLKSKLQEVANEKERLEQQNKQLQEHVKNLEFQLQQGGGMKGIKQKVIEPKKDISINNKEKDKEENSNPTI